MVIDWYLLICFLALTIFGAGFLIYPLKTHKKLAVFLTFGLLLGGIFLYCYLGSFNQWHLHLKRQNHNKKVKDILAKYENITQITEKLKATLKDDKNSAKGWYLLGKLYSSQGQWMHAKSAFAKAHFFLPDEKNITINYVESIWHTNNHAPLDNHAKNLLIKILNNDVNQPDCLSLLAMDAYISKDYDLAIKYWKQLQMNVTQNSKEAKMLDKAILKAESFKNHT